jgi:hypothetical protein
MRVFGYCTGAQAVTMVALADDLGLVSWMDGAGACTSTEIAKGMGLHERWIRELLSALVRPSDRR